MPIHLRITRLGVQRRKTVINKGLFDFKRDFFFNIVLWITSIPSTKLASTCAAQDEGTVEHKIAQRVFTI